MVTKRISWHIYGASFLIDPFNSSRDGPIEWEKSGRCTLKERIIRYT